MIARAVQPKGIVLEPVEHPLPRRIWLEVRDVVLMYVNLHSRPQFRVSTLTFDLLDDFPRGKRLTRWVLLVQDR